MNLSQSLLIGCFCRWSYAKAFWRSTHNVCNLWKCEHGFHTPLSQRVMPFTVGRQWMSFTLVHTYHRHGYNTRRSYAKKAKSQNRLDETETELIDLERLEASMQAALNALKYEYTNTVIARITPAALDRVSVEIDGQRCALKQVAQIGMPNPSLMVINLTSYPQAVQATVDALRNTDLNLNPIPEKNVVKVPIPKMSKELRESLVKVAKSHSEKAKVGIRKVRQKGISEVKKKDVSKDTIRKLEKHIQQLTDDYTLKVDEMLKAKTTELTKGS